MADDSRAAERGTGGEGHGVDQRRNRRRFDRGVGSPPGWDDDDSRVLVPRFTTDVVADHQVLLKVRETWPSGVITDFDLFLGELYRERKTEPFGRYGELADHIAYHKVGDYSRAALSVVRSSGEAVR